MDPMGFTLSSFFFEFLARILVLQKSENGLKRKTKIHLGTEEEKSKNKKNASWI